MSQHISGYLGQEVSHDHGPFITIGYVRIRRDMIGSYFVEEQEHKGTTIFLLRFGWIGEPNSFFKLTFNSREERDKEVEKLDWIFGKIYNRENR